MVDVPIAWQLYVVKGIGALVYGFTLALFLSVDSSFDIEDFLWKSRYCWCQASCFCPFSGVQNLLEPLLCICAVCDAFARATHTFCYPLLPHSVCFFSLLGATSPPVLLLQLYNLQTLGLFSPCSIYSFSQAL